MMWLTHTFFCYYWLQRLVYLPRYSPLIFLWLTALSYGSAKLIRLIYRLIARIFASRGAKSAVFVDMRRDACDIVRENLTKTRLLERAQIVRSDFQTYLKTCRQTFDLVFLDPPYAEKFLENAMFLISEIDILSDSGIIICEHPVEKQLPETFGRLRRERAYHYGRAAVALYRKSVPESIV